MHGNRRLHVKGRKIFSRDHVPKWFSFSSIQMAIGESSGSAAKRGFVMFHPSLIGESPRSLGLFREDYASFLFDSDEGAPDAPKEIVGLKTLSYLKLSAFMYSLTNITGLAVPFVLKDTLLLTPSQLGLFSALCAVPSFLKPVCTLLIHRSNRPVVLTAIGCAQTAAYITVGLAVTKGIATVPLVCGVMFAHSVATSVGMVLRDSMMIESAARLQSDTAAHYMLSDISMIQRFGLLPVSYLSGYLLSYASPGSVILGAAIFPAVMTVAASFLDPFGSINPHETTTAELESAIDKIKDKKTGLMSTTTGRGLVTTFVPSYADAMFYFYTTDLGFSAEFMGRFQFLGSLAGILGNAVSRYSSDPRRLANAANIFLIPMYASILLITSHASLGPISIGAFVLARHFVIDFLVSMTTLPAAVQLMNSAPKGAEGTYLALTGTLSDAGNVVNSVLSAGVMSLYGIDGKNFTHLSDMVVLSLSGSASMLPAILFYEKDNVEIGRLSKVSIEELAVEPKDEGAYPEERSPRDA